MVFKYSLNGSTVTKETFDCEVVKRLTFPEGYVVDMSVPVINKNGKQRIKIDRIRIYDNQLEKVTNFVKGSQKIIYLLEEDDKAIMDFFKKVYEYKINNKKEAIQLEMDRLAKWEDYYDNLHICTPINIVDKINKFIEDKEGASIVYIGETGFLYRNNVGEEIFTNYKDFD